jgi:hypothetical protein
MKILFDNDRWDSVKYVRCINEDNLTALTHGEIYEIKKDIWGYLVFIPYHEMWVYVPENLLIKLFEPV